MTATRRALIVFLIASAGSTLSRGGIKTLLDAGIEVVVGCEEEAAREINADFIARNTQ